MFEYDEWSVTQHFHSQVYFLKKRAREQQELCVRVLITLLFNSKILKIMIKESFKNKQNYISRMPTNGVKMFSETVKGREKR